IALMALNMWKMSTSSSKISPNNKNKKKTIRIFQNFQKIRMVFFKDRDLCHSLFFVSFQKHGGNFPDQHRSLAC
ncbi:hypothetical protein, partial [Ligilactobacillus murinus]